MSVIAWDGKTLAADRFCEMAGIRGVADIQIEYGTLDVTEVLKSEFCFI